MCVGREQKRQANAIIQVAAAISCLISIINTRHRQRATGGGWELGAQAKSIQNRPGQARNPRHPPHTTKPAEEPPPTRPTIEQWAQIISYAKRVVDDWTAAAASGTRK